MGTPLAGNAGSASAWYAFAGQKLASGDVDGAITAYSQSLKLEPRNAAALNNLGAALIKAGRFHEAISTLENALALQPGYQRALANLGKALREAGHLVEAIARLRDAVVREPQQVSALVNLGDALAAAGELDEAQRTLERAITIVPTLVEAHMTLGIVRLQAGQVSESLSALRTAVALAPNHADAHSNLAHALFFSGDWQGAWPHFEYRFQRHAHRSRISPPADVSRWDGTLTKDQELWLIGEQGLGDQLQFARYAKILSSLGMRCVLACDPRIVTILSAADLAPRIVPLGTPAGPGSARRVPLLSLPAWHRTRSDTVPFSHGYLVADPPRVRRWSERLADVRGMRVALAWAGNPQMETGRYVGRSPPLTALAPLMRVPEARFISLQKYVGEDQLDAVSLGHRILRLPDLDDGPDAFLDTAAVLKCVDLLVTSDTAIAHLSGALGVPTWLCLMREPDWRWMGQGSDTPWYKSMRLFRQPVPGDWASVYTEVAGQLAVLVDGTRVVSR
jgi:tetratricopeptide (TPR) repeat protein